MNNIQCKIFLKLLRAKVHATKNEKIDKRYKTVFGYLAPNNKYYRAHCGHCAEVEYLMSIRRK